MFEINTTVYVASAKLLKPAGKLPVLTINAASNRRVGDKEYTDWISAKIWGERAEKLSAHVNKGDLLLLRGRPEAQAYTRADGSITAELVLHVAELEFLSAKKRTEESPDRESE